MAGLIIKKNHAKLAESLYKSTHFEKTEVEKLLAIFRELVPNQKAKMDRIKFRAILHNTFQMTDDILMDRIFRAFDRDNDSNISMEEWINGLSVFLRGTLDEQTRYCFDVYDLNSNGFITREEIFHMLKNTLIKQPSEEDPDEGVKDLVEITLKKMDFDHDNRVSYADFKQAVEEEPLLLEAFGPCLPDQEHVDLFTKQFCSAS
ncbi:calaxin isoform X2 [Hydra vulgaris]|uniref:Calaxin isoform X2 n=1 Tax=Hydra vulgaris TaxID=6087 RepID=A0ABM4CVX4_HYDVU